MDIAAFSEDTFDTKEWINKTFRSPEAQENKEVFLSSLVAKLQLYVQQVNSAVEDTSEYSTADVNNVVEITRFLKSNGLKQWTSSLTSVIQSLPRVMHDADMILKEAHMLKDKMHSVKEEIMKIEKDTAASMETLEKLDRMKTELQIAKQALHEADNWTLLATDIKDEFESHKIDAVAEKVISMQQSLPALVHSANFEERKLQLEGFKNQLEAMASPHLVNAFTNKNIEESIKFVKMFTGMERLQQLIKYYVKCEKNTVCQKWKNLVDVDQDIGIQDLMSQFYRDLLTEFQTQVKWCTSVFGKSDMVMGVIADALFSLEEDVTGLIDTAVKQEGEQISLLVSLRTLSDNFLSELKTLMLQNDGDPGSDSWKDVLRSVYKVYRNWISAYRRLEERALTPQGLETGLSEGVRGLSRERQALASGVTQALARCDTFTSGLGVPALVSAVQFCILKHLEQYENLLRDIEIEKQTKEEWTMFQICLSLLQNTGELQITIDEIDAELIQALEKTIWREKEFEIDMKKVVFNKGALDQYNSFMNAFKDEIPQAIHVSLEYISCIAKFVTSSFKYILKQTGVKRINVTILMRSPSFPLRLLATSVELLLVHGGVNLICGDKTSVLEGVKAKLGKVTERVTGSSLDLMFAPVRVQLSRASWGSQASLSHQLPDYSYAPLEYITQIGEYLMTLPQHLEPFLKEEGNSPAVQLLGRVCRQTCTSLADIILSTKDVSPNTAKQIAVDIAYLGNVLEDLGQTLPDPLSQMATLLKLPSDAYQTGSAGCSPRFVAAIREMRNIPSS